MNLKNILDGIEGLKAKGELDLEIEGIESNSKKIEKGFLFVAIKGFTVDGHEFIGSAIENGAVAVDKLRTAGALYYDVVLMDIQMPVMDGYMATKKIRSLKDPDLANIPIIALSANAFEEDRKASADAGMDGHLAKPINVSELLKMLCELF